MARGGCTYELTGECDPGCLGRGCRNGRGKYDEGGVPLRIKEAPKPDQGSEITSKITKDSKGASEKA